MPSAKKKFTVKRRDSNVRYIPIGRLLSRQDCVRGYKVKKVLGKGAFGTVAKACRGRKCKYVMKVQSLTPKKSIGFKPRNFWDEVRVTKKAGVIGVSPKLKDAWTCDGNGYMIMDMVKGKTLYEILHSDPDFKLVTKLQKKAVAALKKAHAHGLIHRDIHSLNIMVTDKKHEIKIIDWGLLPEKGYTAADDMIVLNDSFIAPLI